MRQRFLRGLSQGNRLRLGAALAEAAGEVFDDRAPLAALHEDAFYLAGNTGIGGDAGIRPRPVLTRG